MEVLSMEAAILREKAQYHIRLWLKKGKLRIDELVEHCLKANLVSDTVSLPHLPVGEWVDDLIQQGVVKKTIINRREYWVELERR